MRLPWDKPREISIGAGNVIMGHGIKDGRAFVFIRPAEIAGVVGDTPPGYSSDFNVVRATRHDTILWLDGSPHGLMDSIMGAVKKHFGQVDERS